MLFLYIWNILWFLVVLSMALLHYLALPRVLAYDVCYQDPINQSSMSMLRPENLNFNKSLRLFVDTNFVTT